MEKYHIYKVKGEFLVLRETVKVIKEEPLWTNTTYDMVGSCPDKVAADAVVRLLSD